MSFLFKNIKLIKSRRVLTSDFDANMLQPLASGAVRGFWRGKIVPSLRAEQPAFSAFFAMSASRARDRCAAERIQ
jgi:hypothetical protein